VTLYRVLFSDVLVNITGLDRTGALFSPNRVLSQTEADILGPLVISSLFKYIKNPFFSVSK
jgi:hypothetical protein